MESITTTELAERVRVARATARNLVGACIDHRCGVCGRFDTDHVGNSSVGCTDANEIGEEALRQSLGMELESTNGLIAKVRGYDGLQQDTMEVTQRCAKAEMDLVRLTAEYKEQTADMKEQIARLQSAHKEQVVKLQTDYQSFKVRSEAVGERLTLSEAKVDELEAENDQIANNVSQLWVELARSEISDDVMKRLMMDKYNIDIDDETFSFFTPRAPITIDLYFNHLLYTYIGP